MCIISAVLLGKQQQQQKGKKTGPRPVFGNFLQGFISKKKKKEDVAPRPIMGEFT